jgi:transcription-repair coupling factor (superfamily II helicase)
VLGSGAALVARAVAASGRPVVYVTEDAAAAERAAQDLQTLLPASAGAVRTLLPPETTPWAEVNPDRRGAEARLATLHHLATAAPLAALVTTAVGLARKVVPRRTLLELSETVRVDQELDREAFTRRLADAGYARTALVDDPATFAVRGGIVDVWSPGMERPVRIELLGDGVLSIKEFDPDAQRTLAEVREAHLCLAREAPLSPDRVRRAKDAMRTLTDHVNLPTAKARVLTDDVLSGRSFFGADAFIPAFVDLEALAGYLPKDAVFLVEDPQSAVAALRDELARADDDVSRKQGEPHFAADAFYAAERDVDALLRAHPTLALHRTARAGSHEGGLGELEVASEDTPTLFTFDQSDLDRAMKASRAEKGKHGGLDPFVDRIHVWKSRGMRVAVLARTETQEERIATLLSHKGIAVVAAPDGLPDEALSGPSSDAPVLAVRGSLARGVVAPAMGIALVTEEEIFGARAARRAKRADGKSQKARAREAIQSLASLEVGDWVVHVEHGIGRYHGLVHRDVGGGRVDLVVIEYAGGDKLYLPVYRLTQIEKYGGGEGGAPKLDRLGGQTFAKTKARAMREVRKMADELLRLYAERRATTRDPLGVPDDEYRAFEATFPFDETPDQARAIEDVEKDLELPTPMDRLVCGDVGFGKTEVAIRAAFRVASAGRQVAVLCPTTVLAQQHYLGFAARMREHPITVRAMSRFQTKAEQEEVLRGLKQGTVDVVIGTHRLLSKDVHYKKLGLLVVDEEQRFGVSHKERIKQIRSTVDVLTLTATPIPRTLQMAVSGVRDMSVILTPPVDRRAIRTVVTGPDPEILRDATVREIGRGGQVYYVYNRVEGLHERAMRLQELVPSARIAVAHGQMSETALENAMIDFVEGKFDVLCATAIVESGLDIPRANTIIIDRADMFGLAQLYQLRGRVGRSRERAYCYLVVPPANEMSEEARSRIEALERHTELGAGFHIASLDLEIRGAGDLLGAEQSGTVASVGVEMLFRMLDDAVHELRGETPQREIEPELSVDEEALLPEDYVEDVGVRLVLYKRLASAEGDGEIDDIAEELEDRFGPLPQAAKRLVHFMRLKAELRRMRALGCEATKKSVTIHLSDDSPVDVDKLLKLVAAPKSPFKLTPDMRVTRRLSETDPVKGGLDAADLVLGELAKCLKAA